MKTPKNIQNKFNSIDSPLLSERSIALDENKI